MFFTEVDYDESIPTVNGIIQSAWIAEYELKDLLGANFENAKEGAFLERDAQPNPLRKDK